MWKQAADDIGKVFSISHFISGLLGLLDVDSCSLSGCRHYRGDTCIDTFIAEGCREKISGELSQESEASTLGQNLNACWRRPVEQASSNKRSIQASCIIRARLGMWSE